MKELNKSLMPNIKIRVDTLDNRAVYHVLGILKSKNINFTIAEGDNLKDADLIITDKEIIEGPVLRTNLLTNDPIFDFENVILRVLGGQNGLIYLGVDPGKRTGIAVYFGKKLVLSEAVSPWEDAVLYIVKILNKTESNRKIVKIGLGNPKAAEELRKVLQSRFGKRVEIYFVDEQRTTKVAKTRKNQGKEKDKISAIAIAHKHGKKVD